MSELFLFGCSPLAHPTNALPAALARIESVDNSSWRGLVRAEQGNGQVLAMVLSLTVVIWLFF